MGSPKRIVSRVCRETASGPRVKIDLEMISPTILGLKKIIHVGLLTIPIILVEGQLPCVMIVLKNASED